MYCESECECECACEREWFLDNRKCIVSRAISFGYLLCQVWEQCGKKKCQKWHFINAKVIKIINEEYRRGAAEVSAVFRLQFPKDSTEIPMLLNRV